MYSYGHMPFVRLVFALMAGIICATFIFSYQLFYFTLLTISIFGFVLFVFNTKDRISNKKIFISGSMLYLTIFSLGGMISSHYQQLDDINHFSKYPNATHYLTEIKSIPDEKTKSFKTIVNVKSYLDSLDLWQSCSGTLLIYTQKDSIFNKLLIGDEILISNKIQPVSSPSNPGEFNYKRYLAFKYIHHQVYLKKGEFVLRFNNKFSVKNLAGTIRNRMSATLSEFGLKNDNFAVASALLLGEKGLLDPEIQQAYASAGAMHVLAVSGLHVGIIYLVLNSLLSLLFKSDRSAKIKTLIIIIALWLYAFITGLSPSVVRAATMFSTISLGLLINNKQNIYNTLASSAFVLMLIKPNFLFEVGFQLSYLAVIGIVYLHPKIYGLFVAKNDFLDRLWSLTAVSFSAQLATFPLGILYFHIFPSYFFLSNLVVIPAAVIIMYLGISLFVFSFIEPIAIWLGDELVGIIDALNIFVRWIEKLPYAVIDNILLTVLGTWLLYTLIVGTTLFLVKKRIQYLVITLLSFCLLVGSNTLDYYKFRNHDYLCVYHISKNSAINILSDDYNFMLDVGVLDVDLNLNPFQMKNNWIRHGSGNSQLIKVKDLPLDCASVIDENIIGVGGKSIAIVSKRSMIKYENPLLVDYLIIVKHKDIQMDQIIQKYSTELIILDSSFSPYYANKYKSVLPLYQQVHCTSLDGGIEIRLD